MFCPHLLLELCSTQKTVLMLTLLITILILAITTLQSSPHMITVSRTPGSDVNVRVLDTSPGLATMWWKRPLSCTCWVTRADPYLSSFLAHNNKYTKHTTQSSLRWFQTPHCTLITCSSSIVFRFVPSFHKQESPHVYCSPFSKSLTWTNVKVLGLVSVFTWQRMVLADWLRFPHNCRRIIACTKNLNL